MRYFLYLISSILLGAFIVSVIPFNSFPTVSSVQKAYAASPIQHVFIIMEENHNWSDIKGSSAAPYINNTLLPMGGHAEQYFNPPGIHPSEPNYIWLEAGTNFGITNDNNPSSNHQSSTNHLVTLLTKTGFSWKAYQEDISGTNCPLTGTRAYAPKHLGPLFFDDVTNTNNAQSQNCIQHVRPYTEFTTNLTNNSVANYNLITPNLNNDMHDGTIQQADSWLSREVPKILNSQAYKSNGLLVITWDEGEGRDGPIGMIVISPFAKKNYSNTIHYNHSSTLKTIEEIFGLSPLLGGAANATDLSDFFTTNITAGAPTVRPQPTNIIPTLVCLGSCLTTPSPTRAAPTPSSSPVLTAAPTQNPCVTSASTGAVHIFKAHKHTNGAISNLLLLLLQFLLQLLQQLLGTQITLPHPNPTPTPAQPTTVPDVTATPVPTMNPCVTPTTTTSQSSISPTTGQTTTPFFAHYYIWWDTSHWHAKLGPQYPYAKQPLQLPAKLASDQCTATSAFNADQLIDIPASPLNLYSQDTTSVFSTHIKEAANAGISGFVVSWSGTGASGQTSKSSAFNSRLANLVNQVTLYNQQHAKNFYLLLGYEGLNNSRNPRTDTWVANDLTYFVTTYKTNPAFLTPWYGSKPVIMFLDSRKFAPSDIQTMLSPIRTQALFIGDEHGTADWNRGISNFFDGDGWYFSSQNPITNPGAFTQLSSLATVLKSENKLWFAPLSGGYNKKNFGLGGSCVPRNNGQTMQKIYQGNKQSKPNGFMYISWNEFLENTYIEPSLLYGNKYLNELQSIISANK